MKRIFTEKLLHRLILILIVIQPIIDLDYLAYDFLDSYGLPRPATIIRFLVIPALAIWSFCLREKNKKRTFVLALIYGIAFLGYFYLHCRQAVALYPRLDLTENFRFDTWQELTYVLTLVLPYAAVYFIYHEHFDTKELRSMSSRTARTTERPSAISSAGSAASTGGIIRERSLRNSSSTKEIRSASCCS